MIMVVSSLMKLEPRFVVGLLTAGRRSALIDLLST
jgi:hypothetical protein